MSEKTEKEQKNYERFLQEVEKLTLTHDAVIAFDFDELIVPIHLARTVTDKISWTIDENKLNELGKSSFEGIEYIRSLFYGYSFGKYKVIRDKICKETSFQKGFDELLLDLQKNFDIIIITAGLKDICQTKLSEIDFKPDNIIGGILNIDGNTIRGSNLIITNKMKGDVVSILKKKGKKVIAIGHNESDRFMLKEADISIAFNASISTLAQYNVSSIEEVKNIINVYLK